MVRAEYWWQRCAVRFIIAVCCTHVLHSGALNCPGFECCHHYIRCLLVGRSRLRPHLRDVFIKFSNCTVREGMRYHQSFSTSSLYYCSFRSPNRLLFSQVAKYLQGPLTFHNNPPTGIRPRHRNHHLSSQLAVDSQGKEHMLLNFYVKGQPPGSDSDSDSEHGSCWESASQWAAGSGSLPEMSFEAHMAMAREKLESVAETCRQLFKFLSGEQVPTPRDVAQPSSEVMEEKKETGWMSSITGIFSSLKGPSAAHTEHFEDPAGPVDTDGEVHADLVMVSPSELFAQRICSQRARTIEDTLNSDTCSSTCQVRQTCFLRCA